jgi:hypothetical protein
MRSWRATHELGGHRERGGDGEGWLTSCTTMFRQRQPMGRSTVAPTGSYTSRGILGRCHDEEIRVERRRRGSSPKGGTWQ